MNSFLRRCRCLRQDKKKGAVNYDCAYTQLRNNEDKYNPLKEIIIFNCSVTAERRNGAINNAEGDSVARRTQGTQRRYYHNAPRL